MKRIFTLLLSCSLMLSLFACGKSEESKTTETNSQSKTETTETAKEEIITIRASSLNKEIALPLYYMSETGMDVENGFKLELSAYDGGALVNEALGAKLWDVSALGAASVMSMAKYDCVHVFAHQAQSAGQYSMVRPDSEIMTVKGYNPDYPDVYGSPDTVRGKTILVTIGTGNHMQVSAWLNAIGLTDADVNLVHMEYAQAWQAFNAGEGDIVAVTYPYTDYALEAGYAVASDFDGLGISYSNNVIATKEFYEEHYDVLVKLVEQIILADEALQDLDTLVEWGVKWYSLNGNEIDEETARKQFECQPYFGLDAISSDDFVPGDVLKVQADFSLATNSITPEEYDVVIDNIKSDVYADARAELIK